MFYIEDEEEIMFEPDVDDPDLKISRYSDKNIKSLDENGETSLIASMATLNMKKAYSWHNHVYLYTQDNTGYADEYHYDSDDHWEEEEESHNVSTDSIGFITIEALKDRLQSCLSCGVKWTDHHVSLDCKECGGYAMERPCPECEGHCTSVWQRDTPLSHSLGKASWTGKCSKTDCKYSTS